MSDWDGRIPVARQTVDKLDFKSMHECSKSLAAEVSKVSDPLKRPWKSIDVFPVKYVHHVYMRR
jgi:hypothetical protein